MTRPEAIRLALNILKPLAEAGDIYDAYQADEGFSDEQYEAMLAVLHADDPASKEGPWSVFYEAEGNVYRIGPFDNKADAEQAAKSAQAEGEFDINDQMVYLVGPDHRMIVVSEEDVVGVGEDYDGELAADQILERQELEDFEGIDPFEGAKTHEKSEHRGRGGCGAAGEGHADDDTKLESVVKQFAKGNLRTTKADIEDEQIESVEFGSGPQKLDS